MSFETLRLPPPILQALRELRYEKPTPIQQQAIPLILQGRDVVGQSETGSGKTAAFGLPTLGRIHGHAVSMLVLTPTRELCVQVCESLAKFSRHLPLEIAAVYGGVGMNPQIKAVRTAQVVVATPGRLLDIVRRGAINLRSVQVLVLDEADRMFDMGFIDDVESIIRQTPANRQTLLFSATMPLTVRHLVQKYQRDPAFVKTTAQVDRTKLRESYYDVSAEDKFSLLAHLLKADPQATALVFCGTRRTVDKVTKNLRKAGIDARAIHGGLSQHKRSAALDALHRRQIAALIATDIAARGLHIQNVTHVYNYDLPPVAEDYTHRIGRTARAGAEGDAITLLSPGDAPEFRAILRIGHNPARRELPQFERIESPKPQQKPGLRPSHMRHKQFPRQERHLPQHAQHPAHAPHSEFSRGREANRERAQPEHRQFRHHVDSPGPRGEEQRHAGAPHGQQRGFGSRPPWKRYGGQRRPLQRPAGQQQGGGERAFSRETEGQRPAGGYAKKRFRQTSRPTKGQIRKFRRRRWR
jgi:ATP-dependent RNA helicase DeaD